MEQLYAGILFAVGFWFVFRNKVPFNQFYFILFILLNEGLWEILLPNNIYAVYKIATFAFVILLLGLALKSRKDKNKKLVYPGIRWFIVYTIFVVLSVIFNRTIIIDGISYYRSTLLGYLLFITFFYYALTPFKISKFYLFFKRILILQVIGAVLKFFLIGFSEKVVGTFSRSGGAVATIFSLMALAILFAYYFYYNRDRRIFVWSLLFLLIPIMSFKRAVWFIAPVVIFISYLYHIQLYGKGILANTRQLFIIFFTVIIVFYFGVRLNQTLNPERKIWGSFDLHYVIEYAKWYNIQEDFTERTGLVSGRASVSRHAFFESLTTREIEKVLLGYGIQNFIGAEHHSQFFEEYLGVISRGGMTGIVWAMWSAGILAAIALLFFYMQFLPRLKRLRSMVNTKTDHLLIFITVMLTLIILFDYLFYTMAFINSIPLHIIYFAFLAITLRKSGATIEKIKT